jgi:hypothetical protein
VISTNIVICELGDILRAVLLKLFTLEQFSALAVSYRLPSQSREEVMENFAELIQRLLEIQGGGGQRSPEQIAEDERLIEYLQKRHLAGRSKQPGQAA